MKEPKSPGPGYYDANRKYDKSNCSIFSKAKVKERNSDTPGPGAYELRKEFLPQSKITFAQKSPGSPYKSESPGPAAYDPKILDSKVVYSIGKAKKQRQSSMFELPSEFNYSGDYKPKNSISFSIGKAEKLVQKRHQSLTPGPGSYYIEAKPSAPVKKIPIPVNKNMQYLYDTPVFPI